MGRTVKLLTDIKNELEAEAKTQVTAPFEDTVVERMQREPEFCRAILKELADAQAKLEEAEAKLREGPKCFTCKEPIALECSTCNRLWQT